MKITFDIPDWALGQNLYLVTPTELVAYRDYQRVKIKGEAVEGYGPIMTKVERCNGCGECCDDDCPYLSDKGCTLKYGIPIGCLISDCSRHGQYPKCTEQFK